MTLQRSAAGATNDQALWVAIRNRTDAINFDRYNEFIDRLLCLGEDDGTATCPRGSGQQAKGYGATAIGDIRTNLDQRPNIYGPDAYYLLKLAAQAFLIFESGIVIDPPRNLDTGEPDLLSRCPDWKTRNPGSVGPLHWMKFSVYWRGISVPWRWKR